MRNNTAIAVLFASVLCVAFADCGEVEGKYNGDKYEVKLKHFTELRQAVLSDMNALLQFSLCNSLKTGYCASGTSVCFYDSNVGQYISFGTTKSQTLTFAKTFNGAEATFSQGSTCAQGKKAASTFRFVCANVFSMDTIECTRTSCFLNCTVNTNRACRIPD